MKDNEINKSMDDKNSSPAPQVTKQPDEKGGIYMQSRVKIFDPETNEVFLDGRA